MFKLLGAEKLIVGIDISDSYTQISYCTLENEEQIETLSMTAGVEKFNIPTLLCKKPKSNQWFIGKDALKCADEENGILIRDLLKLTMQGEIVELEGADVEAEILFHTFLKKCVSLLNKLRQSDRIEAVMFTGLSPDKRWKEVLKKAALNMKFKEDRIFFQSHSESFYYYMLSQPKELWDESALLFEYNEGEIRTRRLKCNRDRTPAVVYIDEKEYPFIAYSIGDREKSLEEELDRMDKDFLKLCEPVTRNQKDSSIYLIGEEFSTEWMADSLKYLCEKGRVFQGSNLFGKGACYGLARKIKPQPEAVDYIFMGADKLKSNVGMKLFDQGTERNYTIFEAGISWYDADSTFEIYIQEGNQIDIMLTSVIGAGNKLAQIILEGLSGNVSRLKIHMHFTEINQMTVEIEDLGLGTMRPGSHNLWHEVISI